jgi:hypothetical protein
MKKLTLIPLVLLLLATTACTKTKEEFDEEVQQEIQTAAKGDIQTGTWSEDGTVFTNEWSELKFTLPDGYVASSDEELAEMSVDMPHAFYDFFVQPSDGTGFPNMLLIYENMAWSVATNSLDENRYFDVMSIQFKEMESQGTVYSEIERTTETVAGAEWACAKYSIDDGTDFQDYYMRKVDGVMYEVIVTYSEDTADAAATLLSAITAIE